MFRQTIMGKRQAKDNDNEETTITESRHEEGVLT